MGDMGLEGAYGAQGAADALRQIIKDRIAAQQRAQDLQQQTFTNNRLTANDARQAEEHAANMQSLAEQRAAAAEQSKQAVLTSITGRLTPGQTLNATDSATLPNYLKASEPLQAPAAPDALAEGPQGGAMAGTIANSPSPQARTDIYTGTEKQRGDEDKKQIMGRLIMSTPAGSRERQALEYEQATGRNAPTGMFDKQVKPDASSPYAAEREARNLQSVDELLGKTNAWTTGAGSMLANIPATDARNFKAELDTLKANIAFGELTAMREASKTGGALGQVSDSEERMLTSALGGLDTGQSPQNFRAQLQKVKDSIVRWRKVRDGGIAPPAGGGVQPPLPGGAGAPDTDGSPAAPEGWKYVRKPGGGWTAVAVSPVAPRPNEASVAAAPATEASPVVPTTRPPLDAMRYPEEGQLASPAPRQRGNAISAQGRADLQTREGGFVADAYPDVTGPAVGYGMHEWQGKPVTAGMHVEQPAADAEMDRQIKAKYGRVVDDALRVPVSQSQYDALVSMAWNLPAAAKRVIEKLNNGQPITAQDFQVSATVHGQHNAGLGHRRESEFASFTGTP